MLQNDRSFFFLLLGWLYFPTVSAQDSTVLTKPSFVHASVYYDFPKSVGASAGVDLVLKSKLKTRTGKNNVQKIMHRDLILNADIGFYRYQFNNTGIFLLPAIGKRYSGSKPHYFEWLLGAGLVRTFYDGIVYAVDDNGKVSIKNYYGRFYATTNIAATFGWDFAREKHSKPWAIQVKPVLWFQFPYNSFIMPHLSIEAGIKYHFNHFNTHVKAKIAGSK